MNFNNGCQAGFPKFLQEWAFFRMELDNCQKEQDDARWRQWQEVQHGSTWSLKARQLKELHFDGQAVLQWRQSPAGFVTGTFAVHGLVTWSLI